MQRILLPLAIAPCIFLILSSTCVRSFTLSKQQQQPLYLAFSLSVSHHGITQHVHLSRRTHGVSRRSHAWLLKKLIPMPIMSRGVSVGGQPHPNQYLKHHDPPQYQAKTVYAHPTPRAHSGPRYIPNANGTNPTYGSAQGTQQQHFSARGEYQPSMPGMGHMSTSAPSLSSGVLSQSMPMAHKLHNVQYGTSVHSTQPPRPRQGRYSVTNLDFKDFQAANDVASFLRFLRLHKYIETVERQGITLMQLLSLNDQELQDIGFRTIGARTRLVKGIERFHDFNVQRWNSSDSTGMAASSSSGLAVGPGQQRGRGAKQQQQQQGGGGGRGGWDVDAYFGHGGGAEELDGGHAALADDMLRFLWIDEGSAAAGAGLPDDDEDGFYQDGEEEMGPEGRNNVLAKIINTGGKGEQERDAEEDEEEASGGDDSSGDGGLLSPTYDLWGGGAKGSALSVE